MRAQLTDAMKARDAVKTGFLRYWIAQLTLGTGAEVSDEEAVKKMRGILKEAKAGPTTFSADELALIREWVPQSLTPEQITAALGAVTRPDQGCSQGRHGHGHRHEGPGRPAGGERRRQGGGCLVPPVSVRMWIAFPFS